MTKEFRPLATKIRSAKAQEEVPRFPNFALLKDFARELDAEEIEHDAANVTTLDGLLELLQQP